MKKKSTILTRNRRKRSDEESETTEEENDDDEAILMLPEEPESRLIGLYGSIDEEKCAQLIGHLYHLKDKGKKLIPSDPEKPESEAIEVYEPIDFLPTEGGAVTDMFALYDVMRIVEKDCSISTLALGKVMSAGVLLLAAGTPGQRRSGKNCRFMLHSIASGSQGHLHDLENNVKEMTWYQEQYIKNLVELSNGKITEGEIKKIFQTRIDHFFDAEQALSWGIIDEIV